MHLQPLIIACQGLMSLVFKSSLAAVNKKCFSLMNCSLSSCCLILSDENTAFILKLAFSLIQAPSVALLECACVVAMAWKRNVCSLSASEVSVTQFKTAVVSGKEITVFWLINLLSKKDCLFCICDGRQFCCSV